jgi:hypothetical protein
MRSFAALCMVLLLAACGQPVPADKSEYVGDWRGKEMRLLITQDGRVEYSRRNGQSTTNVSAPLQGFDGDNVVAGVGFLRTTFVVSKPPHLEGAAWKMVVDGVELTRGAGGGESFNT